MKKLIMIIVLVMGIKANAWNQFDQMIYENTTPPMLRAAPYPASLPMTYPINSQPIIMPTYNPYNQPQYQIPTYLPNYQYNYLHKQGGMY